MHNVECNNESEEKEMSKELLELIAANPDLPVYAWVDWEVVQDDCHYWAGKFRGNGEIKEYIDLDYSYQHSDFNDWLFKDDTEDWEEYMYENYLEDGMTEEEAEKEIQDELSNMKWKKAIFVWVETI